MNSDKFLIADLLKENQQFFAKMYSEDNYIKNQLACIEPILAQQGVALARGDDKGIKNLSKLVADICGKVSLSYARKHIYREKVKDNFKEIDRLRGKVHD